MRDKKHLQRNHVRRQRRRHRIRKSVIGTATRPRLVVHRSLRNIEVQIIDDSISHSLVGLSTLGAEMRDAEFDNRVAQGHEVGRRLAEKARDRGIETVVFDRGGFRYHGIVKAVAEGAREGGLKL